MKPLYVILIIISLLSFGQGQTISDGPYIFIEKNQLIEKQIINGKVFSKIIETSSYDTTYLPEKSTYNNIKKIAALSDIHGQYDLLIELFKNNKIIDDNLNWSFGNGHLVHFTMPSPSLHTPHFTNLPCHTHGLLTKIRFFTSQVDLIDTDFTSGAYHCIKYYWF